MASSSSSIIIIIIIYLLLLLLSSSPSSSSSFPSSSSYLTTTTSVHNHHPHHHYHRSDSNSKALLLLLLLLRSILASGRPTHHYRTMAPLATIVAQELLTYRSFVHAVSGCVGGATAITLFYPLNTVRLRLQVDPSYEEQATFMVLAEIYIEKRALGALPRPPRSNYCPRVQQLCLLLYLRNVQKRLPYFYVTQGNPKRAQPCDRRHRRGDQRLRDHSPLGSYEPLGHPAKDEAFDPRERGSLAPTVHRRVRLFAKSCAGGRRWCSMEWGISILDISIEPNYSIFAYERCRRLFEAMALRQRRQITSLEFFAAGAFAKAIATFLTYPIQLAQSRLRTLNLRHADRKLAHRTNTVSLLRNYPCGKGSCRLVQGLWGKNVADHADSRISIHGQRGVISHCRRGPGW